MSRTEPALIVYAEEDESFVRGYLAPGLGNLGDGRPAARLLGGAELRASSVTALEGVLGEHAVVVVVLSPAFLSDPWARLSEQLASTSAVLGERRVIPLRLAACEVPLRLDATTGLDFAEEGEAGDGEEVRWARWGELVERLRRDLALPAPTPRVVVCPYPGLRPYQAGDSAYYFGRQADVEAVVGRLTAGARELFLVGPSGCGKSSLLGAGVLPRLVEQAAGRGQQVLVRQLRPGAHPTAALSAALGGKGATTASAATVEAAAEALLLGAPHSELLVVIDQLEELFTQAEPSEHRELAAAVRALRGKPRVSLLLAMRADFFSDLLQSALWAESAQVQVAVAPLRGAALRETIERPAREVGVYFEAGLLEMLLADASEEPGALPLLQETMVRLWAHRRERLLALSAYRTLGSGGRSGLAVALAQHAERSLTELTEPQRAIAQRVFVRLVTFGEGRPHTRRRQRRKELSSAAAEAEGSELSQVLDALARARLLTIDQGESPENPEDDRVDLCHDALVVGWPRFGEWIRARQADERQRRKLERNAKEWVEAGRGTSGLLDAKRHAVAAAWMDTAGARETGWSEEVAALVQESRRALERAQRRRRRRVQLTLAAVAVAAVVATGQAWWALREQRRAMRSEQRAFESERVAKSAEQQAAEQRRAGELAQYLRTAEAHLEVHEPQRAIPYLVAARELGYDSLTLRSQFRRATTVVQVASIELGDDTQPMGIPSPDGALVLLYGRGPTAALWNPRTQTVVAELPHDGEVEWAAFAPDGTRLVTADSGARALVLWDLTARPPRRMVLTDAPVGGRRPSTLVQTAPEVHARRLWSGGVNARFSDDGGSLLSTYDLRPRLWDARTGAPIGGPFGEPGIKDAVFAGERVIAVRADCVVSWRLQPFAEERRACGFAAVNKLVFGRGAARVALQHELGARVTLWDPATGSRTELVHEASGSEVVNVGLVAMTHGGRWLVSADALSVQRHELSGDPGRPSLPIASYRPGCQIQRVVVDSLGDRALVLCDGSSTRLVDLATGTEISALYTPRPIDLAAVSANGATAVTIDTGDVLRVWDLRGAPGPRQLTVPWRELSSLSPDAAFVAAHDLGPVRLFSTRDGRSRELQLAPSVDESLHLLFSPDATLLAAVSRHRDLYVWDVATGRLLASHKGATFDRPQLATWSADSRTFAAIAPAARDATDEQVLLWRRGASEFRTMPRSFPGLVHALRVLADGDVLLGGTAGLVQRWSNDGRSARNVLDARDDPRLAPWVHANFSGDGRWLAAAAARTLRLWRLDETTIVREVEGVAIDRVFFATASTVLLTVDARAKLTSPVSWRAWELPSGASMTGSDFGRREILCFDPVNGERVATKLPGGAMVRLARTDEPLSNELRSVTSLRVAAFSDDGRWLALWSANNQLTLWNVAVDDSPLDAWRAIDRSNVILPLAQQQPRSRLGLTPLAAPVVRAVDAGTK